MAAAISRIFGVPASAAITPLMRLIPTARATSEVAVAKISQNQSRPSSVKT